MRIYGQINEDMEFIKEWMTRLGVAMWNQKNYMLYKAKECDWILEWYRKIIMTVTRN